MNVLLAIDIQEAWHSPAWEPRNNPTAESMMDAAIQSWRKHQWDVVHVQHLSNDPLSPLHPSSSGVHLMDFARPLSGEKLVQKSVNSAFIGTDLLDHLKKMGAATLTFIGFTTDHCVSTSARMAANYGFRCFVLEDATATFERISSTGKKLPADLVHEYALASLKGEFAAIARVSTITEVLQ